MTDSESTLLEIAVKTASQHGETVGDVYQKLSAWVDGDADRLRCLQIASQTNRKVSQLVSVAQGAYDAVHPKPDPAAAGQSGKGGRRRTSK